MTNGLPLSVRAAIKPISTLTKPLRSVDTETKQPAQALRERTDSTVVPAAAVVGEAMVALTLARCLPREVRRRPHRRRARRGRRLQEAHRLPGLSRCKPAIVFIGFMGAGKSTALAAAREAGLETTEIDELMERELGMPIAEAFERDGEEALPRAARPRSSARCWRRPTAARSPSAAAASSRERIRAALGRHIVVWLQVDAGESWRRIAHSDRPLATSAEDVERAAGRAPAALRGARRRGGAGRRPRRSSSGRCRRSRRSPSCPPGRSCSGPRAPPASTRSWSGRGLLGAGLVAAARGGASASPTAPWRRSTPSAWSRSPAAVEVEPGEGAKTMAEAERVLRELARRRDDPRGPRRRARRRRRRRSRRLLRPPLPARRAGGPGADDPGRPGRLRLRRQDRRRPARGQELRRRLPPAGGGDRRHRDAGDAARRRSWPPASSRC